MFVKEAAQTGNSQQLPPEEDDRLKLLHSVSHTHYGSRDTEWQTDHTHTVCVHGHGPVCTVGKVTWFVTAVLLLLKCLSKVGFQGLDHHK